MKNEVHLSQVKWSSSSDLKCNDIDIVICQVLSAVDSNEADSWKVNLGALSHLQ